MCRTNAKCQKHKCKMQFSHVRKTMQIVKNANSKTLTNCIQRIEGNIFAMYESSTLRRQKCRKNLIEAERIQNVALELHWKELNCIFAFSTVRIVFAHDLHNAARSLLAIFRQCNFPQNGTREGHYNLDANQQVWQTHNFVVSDFAIVHSQVNCLPQTQNCDYINWIFSKWTLLSICLQCRLGFIFLPHFWFLLLFFCS